MSEILQDSLAALDEQIKQLRQRKNRISFLRLFLFLISFFLFYKYLQLDQTLLLTGSVLLFAAFIALIFLSASLQEKIDFAKTQKEIIEEIRSPYLNRYAPTATADHPFSKDLDILGPVSLFSLLNRTQTAPGALQLGQWLLHPLCNAEKIKERQESLQELSQKTSRSLDFLTHARLANLTDSKQVFTDPLSNKKPESSLLLKIADGLPVLYILLFIVSFATGLYSLAGITVVLMIAASYILAHKYDDFIAETYEKAQLKSEQLKGLIQVFQRIENEEFTAPLNQELQKVFLNPKASEALKKLELQVKNLDNGFSSYFGFVLNLFLIWNLRYALKVHTLLKDYQGRIPLWMESFSKIEALISMGFYVFKSPDFIYPEPVQDLGKLEVSDLHHPLIPKDKSVSNSFTIQNHENVAIITGANMTGKSTFLRTIGANLILAMNGLPVHASQFRFQPMKIFSSMRTSDSLSDGSSYFHAEIFRLKAIREDLEKRIPLYIILDEILKGTNSADKLEGSRLFLKNIIALGTPFSCLIATHDLDLTHLAEEDPDHVRNFCFELQHQGKELLPDYRIKPGATTSMNALYLMRKFGIVK